MGSRFQGCGTVAPKAPSHPVAEKSTHVRWLSQMEEPRHGAAKKQRTVSVVMAPLMKGLLQAVGVEILHRLVDLIS